MRWPICIGAALHALALLGVAAAIGHYVHFGDDLLLFVGLFAVLGDIALIDGLASYAQYKGYSARWAILGLLSVPGAFVIWRLPYLESEYSSRRPAGFDVILLGMDDEPRHDRPEYSEPHRRTGYAA